MPPEDNVTFLFTAIDESAALWEAHAGALLDAFPQHDALLHATIQEAGGQVFKTMGGAFFAAFSEASAALEAALRAQQALVREAWPAPIVIRVRMALYTGTVLSRGADYFGPPLNRAARLLASGYGGQILVSQPTAWCAQEALPAGAVLRELGEHYLRDLVHPEPVYQLCAPGLRADFPPLRSLSRRRSPNNLPHPTTSFVGREKERAQLKALLEKTRLLTLTGSGGCGKTRLAIQVAAEQLDHFAAGVWLVELAPLSDPAQVASRVALVLGLKEKGAKSVLEQLVEHIGSRSLLLVLDNCEHLLEACARLAGGLLSACPNLVILTSSREGLGLPEETTYRVPSLSLPDLKRDRTVQSLLSYEAIRLFVDRALQMQARFTLTNANALVVASICCRLDGIPLALELAAARVRTMSIEQIEQRLDRRFQLLTRGSRTALPRQQTLRSLIDWSYDLLEEAEKGQLCRLSVFVGGWTQEIAEALFPGDVFGRLSSLAEKSLITVEAEGEQARYSLLETVRQYARERLQERGEETHWQERHAAYFVTLVEAADPHLSGENQKAWQDRLEAEHDNLRAALAWSCGAQGQPELMLRLCGVLWRFWFVRGYLAEGLAWCRTALAQAEGLARTSVLSKVFTGAGVLARSCGDFAYARSCYEESLAICREQGDRKGVAFSLSNLGGVAYRQGELAAAQPLYTECLTISREGSDRHGMAVALSGLGNVMMGLGELDQAHSYQEEALALQRELENRHGIAYALSNLGKVTYYLGEYDRARSLFSESLTLRLVLGDRLGTAVSLEGLASVSAAQGEPLRAIRLWGAVEQLREELGAPHSPEDRKSHSVQVAAARAALAGQADFARVWQEGRSLGLDQAVALAQSCAATP